MVDFFEAFELLQVNTELKQIYKDTQVENITMTPKMDQMNISLRSTHLLTYKDKTTMEYQIKKQLFQKENFRVSLLMKFDLSEAYTPQTLLREYEDSIYAELRERDMILYEIFQTAEYRFEDNTLVLSVTDNVFSKEYAQMLQNYFCEVFEKRCNIPVNVRLEYVKKEEKKEEPVSDEEYDASAVKYLQALQEGKQKLPETSSEEAVSPDVPKKEEPKQEKEKASLAVSSSKEVRPPVSKEPAGDAKPKYQYRKKLPDDPNIIYGRPFEGESIAIKEIQDEIGDVIIHGKILRTEIRELKTEKILLIGVITDFTDTISFKLFAPLQEKEELEQKLSKGQFVSIKGIAKFDKYDNEVSIASINGIRTISDFRPKRMDQSEKKRVELHLHTVMSDMDGIVDVKTLIKRVKSWGHKAIAITDHGVVQSFADAAHALDKDDDLKIIYGMEGYLVDDVKAVAENEAGQTFEDSYVAFDIETTGFGPVSDKIIEIGAVKIAEGKIVDEFSAMINPEIPIPYRIVELTGITDDMVKDAPLIDKVLPEFLDFVEGSALIAHNASFDVGFITQKAKELGRTVKTTVVDTVSFARVMLPTLGKYKLNIVANELNVSLENHHRAVDDAKACGDIFIELCNRSRQQGITTLRELNQQKLSPEVIKKMPTYHIILLAKNDIGRVNLYRMVSKSHIEYFARRPRIPKSLLEEHREGIIIGSACEAGELYQAILGKQSREELTRIVNFYDYLEIQPLGNDHFMIRDEKYSDIESEEDLKEINRKIVQLGEEFHKPVVATCDVHFLDPEDAIYRAIIMTSKGFADADQQAPLYLRTTEEMLEEFMYLGSKKAEEVVITNTNLIADMIERIEPVRPDKCPPVIENSDETLRKICYDRAHALYGPDLPDVVEKRLKKELDSIIGNGFAVMYIIAQKLVWKSNEDGYLVGSRGSVGSSFVATMSGITEVNPLPAHYYCLNCHYSDFDSDEVKAYAGKSGCDMPDKLCPVCGKPLEKDGHEIPFETFLGFYGDKEPDIDLNFAGEYQSKAHDYTEVIFGKGQTYRAGTVGTLADKTAYGYVLKYDELHGISHRNVERERLAEGCVGVRRTTGQHPGGIVVLPLGEEINTFTPVQKPANKMDINTITTHFDYHKIDHNLLKLDILGHDDPTMIRMLEMLTGIDAKTIRLDDEKVLSLFEDLSALGIKPEDIDGYDLGTLGIPEMGTDFVMGMLRDTKPKSFSDCVRISGLSHGTDVWLNNAQYFIAQGNCTLSTAICTRDDIMTFLIHEGVEDGTAFKIMESVRKGKGLKPEMEEAMKAAGIPEWYMESCRRIKYMFPKAHAVAYVMMAFRIAYFKVYYPLAYYAAYFSIRATDFDYELMALGKEKLLENMKEYKAKPNPTAKEKDTLNDMKSVLEMYARGFEFMPIDIYRAKARHFQIIDGKLMPSFGTINGMGDIAAINLEDEAKKGPFVSREDLRNRGKVNQKVVDKMAEMGLLEGLPESNQYSLFDLL